MKRRFTLLTALGFVAVHVADSYNWSVDPDSDQKPQSASVVIATSATATFTTMFTNTINGEEIQQPTFPGQTSELMIRF